MPDAVHPAPLPEQFRAALGLDENLTLAQGLALAEERLNDILQKQEKLPERHPAHPKLKRDRERVEPIVREMQEMVFGLKVDELCDAAEAVLTEKLPKRAVARDYLRRARLEGRALPADSVYLRRIQKLEAKVEADPALSKTVVSAPAPAPVTPTPIVTPVAETPVTPLAQPVVAAPPPKTTTPENPFLRLETFIDEGTELLQQTPPELVRVEACFDNAEREAAGKAVPEKLRNRMQFLRVAIDRVKKDTLRSQVSQALREALDLMAGGPAKVSAAREKLASAAAKLRDAPDTRLQNELERLNRELSKTSVSKEPPSDGPRTKVLNVQLTTRVRFRCKHHNEEKIREVKATEFWIGRGNQSEGPTLDLPEDLRVSRKHARVWSEGGFFWVEDSGSKFGTRLDGIEIKNAGRRLLNPLSKLQVGDTMLTLMEDAAARMPFQPLAHDSARPAPVKIDSTLDASAPIVQSAEGESPEHFLKRQSWLLELHLELAAQHNLSDLLSLILHRAIEAIPNAERGAVLLRARDSDSLLLAAYVSDGEPPVSETLARKALGEAAAFMWRRGFEQNSAESVLRLNIESGIYAPMVRDGKALGLICVDNPRNENAFKAEDLRLLQALAHYGALAVANQQMQDDLRQNAVLLERLLTNFSPKLRNRIVSKARAGQLRPGGERSEVTILFAEMRGFTAATANRDANEVMELLNDYLPALAQVVFKHEGTIDKFTGDGLLAVFGSPEPDPEQHRHALLAACEMQVVAERISERRKKTGQVACSLGVGLHSGQVLHGFLGDAEMLEFTVIGEAVNLGSRYCSTAPAGSVLLSPQVFQHVFHFVRAEPVVVESKHEGKLNAYRVVELKQA